MAYRIALVSMSDFDRLPPGGEVQLLHNLLSQDFSQDIDLSLVGMSFSADMPAGKWQKKKVGEITYPFFPLCQILKSKERSKIPFRLRMVMGIRKYYQKAGFSAFDAIYLQAPETVLPFTRYTGRIAVHIHTDPDQTLRISRFPIFRLPVFSAMYTRRILRGIRRADRIIWSADAIRDSYVTKRPALADMVNDKSAVIHSCYDPALVPGRDPVPFRDDTTYFITVGRLARGKRIDLLIEVFAAYLQAHPDEKTEFIICGNGEELDALRSIAAQKGIEDKVRFTGDIGHRELAACLQHARLFLFASVSETMSLVVLESLFMGVPVISSNVGDLHLAVTDGRTGFLINDCTKENYLRAIASVLAEPETAWQERCREKAAEFSPQRMKAAVCKELCDMCSDSRTAH